MLSARRRLPGRLLTQGALSAALLGPSFGGATGCNTSCHVDSDPNPQVVEEGIRDLERGTYATSSFTEDFLYFPPEKRYEFRHGLGGTPQVVQTWVSFGSRPLPLDKEFGNAAEPAGNIVIIEAVTPEYVRVRNDTCQKFYLRLVASDPEPTGPDLIVDTEALDHEGGASGSMSRDDAESGGSGG